MIVNRNVENKDFAVDLATGTGFLADNFSKMFSKVQALDISHSQIAVAKEVFRAENLDFDVCNAYEAE